MFFLLLMMSGRVIKTFFAGDGKLTDATDFLEKAVANYYEVVDSC